MERLFIKKGRYDREKEGDLRIKEACLSFLSYAGIEADDITVKRTEKGKPYIEGAPIHVSVSHSKDVWMCLISDKNCGADIEFIVPLDHEKLLERFFTAGEREYIKKGGDPLERFFDVWVRREALGKYIGTGFFGKYPDTCPGGEVQERIKVPGKELVFREINELGCGEDAPFKAVTLSEI